MKLKKTEPNIVYIALKQAIHKTVVRNFEIMSYSKVIAICILFFVLELIAMIVWFYRAQPETISALNVFNVIPILFGINLLVGLLFYFVKKPIGLIFLANSIMSSLLFYSIWIMWFTYWSE